MSINDEELSHYHRRICIAMDYIQLQITHTLYPQLQLETIASKANMSAYHFHRIFKKVIGETVADYIKRLRLEKAAGTFYYFKHIRITEVAFAFGFSSSQNLAKAFKRHFKLSPSEVKAFSNTEQLTFLIQQNRKDGNANNPDFSYAKDSHIHSMESGKMIETTKSNEPLKNQKLTTVINVPSSLKVEAIPVTTVIYKRLMGQYGKNIEQAFSQLQQFVVDNNISTLDPLIINWDNPKITPLEKCRTDVCLTLSSHCHHPAPYNIQTIAANDHAIVRGKFNYEYDYESAWQTFFAQIFSLGYQPLDIPCFKILHLNSSHPAKGIFDISFCQAIVSLK